MKISEVIKNYREQNNLSIRQFAERCRLSPRQILLIENEFNPQTGNNNSPKISTLEKVAKGMNMTLMQLLSYEYDNSMSATIPELQREIANLSPEQQQAVLSMIQTLIDKR